MRTTLILGSIILPTAFAAPAAGAALDIVGRYVATGTNPGGRGNYKGTVEIKKTGETYKVLWNTGAAYIGTGILIDNVLSVAYVDQDKKWVGVVAYRVLDKGARLSGGWAAVGGTTLGKELLVRQDIARGGPATGGGPLNPTDVDDAGGTNGNRPRGADRPRHRRRLVGNRVEIAAGPAS
ncbi:MAG: hypothetical protein OER86_09760 [Phycisphaerae bacterium]|nr:hypothetical protein [Phycisphaerae bacterium]